ncbi:hypothetical protein LOZ80_13815 [Paenibacillus sp. HWE-109]|uniref:ABC-three component system protein n=1 Tax=Paenibacillus sp. HWE-109 TaxID=1306526 RepID=UPI001EDED5DC|nr:ABC-three component system protein [Paenibacillus sp. HWE-109]UKS29948.1 hypothetical protein LOZ80_13815 [Paenibacillus sp. HWE-109]
MSINTIEIERAVARLFCGEEEEDEKATAFLVSNDKVVTATHSIANYFDENLTIRLQFLNIMNVPIERTAVPIGNRDELGPISILQLNESIDSVNLCFVDFDPKKDHQFSTYGYPLVKWSTSNWCDGHISRKVEPDMTNFFEWDLVLDIGNSRIDDFSGLSGAPLFVENRLAGVVITQSLAGKKAISLSAISISKIRAILEGKGLEIKEDIHIQNNVNQVLLNNEEKIFIKQPLTFYEEDIKDLILFFAEECEDIKSSLDNFDLDGPEIEIKNVINNLSDEYFKHIRDKHLSYFSKIKNFLADPRNRKFLKMYTSTTDELQFKITSKRSDFNKFEEILIYLVDYILLRNIDKLRSDRNLIWVFIHFMYWNCDIGDKYDKAT